MSFLFQFKAPKKYSYTKPNIKNNSTIYIVNDPKDPIKFAVNIQGSMNKISKSKIIKSKTILIYCILNFIFALPKDSKPHSYKDFFFIVLIFFLVNSKNDIINNAIIIIIETKK